MHMKIIADDKGLVVKKLFKDIRIPYQEITRIIVTSRDKTVITTRSGEEYEDSQLYGLTFAYPIIMDKIVLHDITFEDRFIVSDYNDSFIDENEKQQYVDSLVSSFEPDANEMIKSRLGPRHDISLEVLEIHKQTVLCMGLKRDGVLVTDLPDCFKEYDDVKVPVSFDTQCLLMMCSWQPGIRSGKYIKALDHENFPDDNKAALMELVEEFCDSYLEVNSREYLDSL